MCGATAPWLPAGALRPDRPDTGVLVLSVLLVVLASAATVRSRPGRIVVAVGALVTAGWAVRWLLADLASGTPGVAVPVLAVAAGATAAGALGCAVADGGPGRATGGGLPTDSGLTADSGLAAIGEDGGRSRPVGSRRVVVWGFVAVLVAAAAVGTVSVVAALAVEGTTAARVEVPAVVERPGGRTWTWRPSGGEVAYVVAAGAGVVVADTGGGVSALDGRTGAQRWRYARPGAHIRALRATPDLRSVLVAFDPGGPRVSGTELLVVLDAVTGEERSALLIDGVLTDVDEVRATDATVVLRDRDDRDSVHGYELVTGERRWTWAAPHGCRAESAHAGAGVALVAVTCADRLELMALDDATGTPRWTHRRQGYDAPRAFLEVSPDGRVAYLDDLAGGAVLLAAADGRVITEVDGSAAADRTPRVERQRPDGTPTVTTAVDPETGERHELDTAACPHRLAATTTTAVYLRICLTGDGTGDGNDGGGTGGNSGNDTGGSGTGGGPVVLVEQDVTGGPVRTRTLPEATGPTGAELVPAPGALVLTLGGSVFGLAD